ncbi:MAG: hypothetical protein CMC35_06875 [Flavobacteriaceae bacterium]|nr:hypothetical protein [Flavobacteriaceae bacterium]|tara:strand:+ start:23380 stop:24039 length:660 start_codon:yes stop_codon:yes gene_type:complete
MEDPTIIEKIFAVIGDFTIYSPILLFLLYAIGFFKFGKAYRSFTCYLLVVAVVQLLSRIGIRIWEWESNLFLSHYYFISQFILLSLFYKILLNYQWIWIVLVGTLGFLTYQYVEDPSMYYKYNPLGMVITQVILVFYSLLYLYRCLAGNQIFMITNIGLFFYLLSSTLIFASGNLVLNLDVPPDFIRLLININLFLYLAFQILILVEWWKNYSKTIFRA